MRKMRFLGVSLLFIVTFYVSFPLYSHSSYDDSQKSQMVKIFMDTASRVIMKQGLPGSKPKHSLAHELKLIFGDLRHSVLLSYLKDTTDVQCVEDIMYVFQNLYSTTDDWAFKMLDSYGKPESGLLRGQLKWLGDYNECLDSYASYDETYQQGGFRGQYCSITVSVPFANKVLPVRLGICLPDSCHSSAFKLEEMIKIDRAMVSPSLRNVDLTCQPISREFTYKAYIVMFLIYFIVLLTVIGSSITAMDYFVKPPIKSHGSDSDIEKVPMKGEYQKLPLKDEDKEYTAVKIGYKGPETQTVLERTKSFFNCFCIFTNCNNLLDSKSSENHLRCLHGIRFLTLCWLLFCNTHTLGMDVIKNVSDVLAMLGNRSSQIVLNGIFCFDSFFLLSGFLVGNMFFNSSKTKDTIRWSLVYFQRYIRITPVYIVVLMFYATMYSHLGSGPHWVNFDTDPACSKNWWWNVLYINNFQQTSEQCVEWSWYLASDFQFFLISPILLVSLMRKPKVGYIVLAAFLSVAIISNFVVTHYLSLTAGFEKINSFDEWQEYFSRLYSTLDYIHKRPYTAISPYLVGIMLAYYLYVRKAKGCGKNGFVTLALGWILSAVVSSLSVFGLYHHKLSVVESCFYHAFSHTAFAASLAWVVYVCVTGQGGFVNCFLSWKFFIPLSRLTFCAYLVHPIIITAFYESQKSLIQFSNVTWMVFFLGFLIISYTVALLTSLLLEAPVIRFEKYFRSIYRKSQQY
ncbi:hypothetical protein JTE90_023505 [Oedothorax gibbosus]|uniref:Nose resistant-to-fluoxetine protein N-terminal domain-containing protein n=1 Tax=Oedothorax gibbosus TaxID=931172 RepID=A0AAV6VRE6_9ARAC|nr:hypothetical protein JTE90_023505 [Oedothorax gibbosus]